jgi:tetratricopeptide (TPR) repeat protein
LARAEATGELEALVEAMLARFPEDAAVARFAVEVARARPGTPALVPRLEAACRLARARGDGAQARHCALDAWLESRGRAGGELLVDVLLAQGEARGALQVAVVSAAQAIAAGASDDAATLLLHAGRAARATGAVAVEATLACVAALFRSDPSLRETARDLLAEAGLSHELSARLRAHARREVDAVKAAAAWKGVAAVERAEAPARAAASLGEALVRDPTDAEARALLVQLFDEGVAPFEAREALAWATRADLPGQRDRLPLLVLLGEMEARAGDPAAALRAFSRAWKAGEARALTKLEAVTPAAEALFARAEAALRALEAAPREARGAALDGLLEVAGGAPGAVRDLAHATRVLAPLAGQDERAAALWLAVTRRLGDAGALVAALRRIATRAAERAVRARAAVDLAEILDQHPEGQGEAIELLLQLLDEQPNLPEAAATLAAIAEHGDDLAVDRAALAAMARAASDPALRELLAWLAGETAASPAPLAQLFDEATSPRDRDAALRAAADVLGESPALLARRTRALLAQPSEAATGLEVARRFAALLPLSPEATIAWFSAAGVARDVEQLADAAVAVVYSLATARDAGSVARAAAARLFSLGEPAHGARVLREAAEALGLADRGLRVALLEYLPRVPDEGTALVLLEAAVAGASDAPGEQLAALRRIAQIHHARGDALGEACALRRLVVLAPAERDAIIRLSTLLASGGDRRALVRVLSLQLASEAEPAARREVLLTLAALQLAAGDRAAVTLTLDRYADEQGGPAAHAEVMRALVAMGEHGAAIERLVRWAERCPDARIAAAMYRAGARLARGSGAALRALALLRAGLARDPESPELLLMAEEIAAGSRLVREMLAVYDDLDALAAGQHGRRALAYRRAAFLEAAGEREAALEIFLGLFEQHPVSGALSSAIERLAIAVGRPQALVGMHRKLAEVAHNGDGQVRSLLEAARVARELAHDRRAALELTLLAHDVKRDEATARQVIETARSLRGLDPHAFRHAVETVVERTLAVADEVWDDALKREMALRAAEYSIVELGDPARCAAAVEVYFKGVEDRAEGQAQVSALLDRLDAPAPVREAVARLGPMRARAPSPPPTAPTAPPPPAPPEPSPREEILAMAQAGDRAGALARARAHLARVEDEPLRQVAETLAREDGDAGAELELIEYRFERTLDTRQRLALTLRAAELLRGPLGRPADARRRLETALASDPENDEILRALHDVAEQLGAWDAVATLLARRIARSTERAETRALRLHRAAVLDQRLDDAAGARAELEAILEDEPAHRAALRYLADLHLRERQFHDAGECFARAAATAPVRAEAAELLAMAGEAFAQGGDEVAADAQFRRALELDARAMRALKGLSEQARRRGDLGALERTLVSLADAAQDERDRASYRLAAARAALDAGALFRAKSHLDAARRIAPAEEVAQLDAVLQDARDNDRPISRTNLQAVVVPPVAPVPAPEAPPAALPERRDTPREWLAASRVVPQAIAPVAPADEGSDADAPSPLPLLVRPPRVPSEPRLETGARRSITAPGSGTHPAALSGTVADLPPSPDPAAAIEPVGYDGMDDEALRETAQHDDGAARALAVRLARGEGGRDEALQIQRQRFVREPTRLDALEAMAGLYHALGRSGEARAVRTVLEVLSGRETSASPPPLHSLPEPPPDAAARMTIPSEQAWVGEIGALLWEALANRYRREVTSYGVTGVDRIVASGPTDIARLYGGAIRLLQLPRTALFVRAEVPGGAMPARTQPPAVILAAPLANASAVAGYMLGQALEATRPTIALACTLDAEERATLVRAVHVAFGASGVMAGAPPAVGRRASELYMTLVPRAQRRLQELLAELEAAGSPFTDELWTRTAEAARARAGLLVCGDFGVAARMVVARHRGGGEPDVPGALPALEPLRELARFAVSEPYMLTRWYSIAGPRVRR